MTGQTLGDPNLHDAAYGFVTNTADQAFPQPGQLTFMSFDTNTLLSNVAMHDTTASAVALTGTVAKTAGSSALTGTGTAFLSQLTVGQKIVVGAETAVVAAITSDTALTVAALGTAGGLWSTTASGVTATVDNRSKVTITDSGIYVLTAALWFTNTTGQSIAAVSKGTGASPLQLANQSGTGGTLAPRLNVTTPPIRLVAGDVVWMGAYQNSNTAGIVAQGSSNSSGGSPVFGFFRVAA